MLFRSADALLRRCKSDEPDDATALASFGLELPASEEPARVGSANEHATPARSGGVAGREVLRLVADAGGEGGNALNEDGEVFRIEFEWSLSMCGARGGVVGFVLCTPNGRGGEDGASRDMVSGAMGAG